MAQKIEKFSFWVPGSFEKGTKDGQEEMKIKGIASSATSDSDGETLLPSGYDYTPLLAGGHLNWDHQSKKSASAIVGEPTYASVVNGGKDFYIEGKLYPDSEEAQHIYKLAKTLEKHSKTRRLGFSIEGQVVERGCGPEFLDEAKTLRNPSFTLAEWNKITKARITGVAITPCPKNPNTLMQIMKGEANNLLMENDYDEEDLEEIKKMKKAMSAEGMSAEGVLPEDVEGTKNPNKVPLKGGEGVATVGSHLKKSEVYNLIAAHYTTDVVKAKQIYTFIQDVTTKLFNMSQISKESIEKAFNFLNEAASPIVKSESAKEDDDKDEDKDKKDDKPDLGRSDTPSTKEPGEAVEKSAEGTDKGETERLEKEAAFKKAKDCAYDMLKKGEGKDRKEMVEGLQKSGHTLEASTAAVESVISCAESLKENGGTVSAGTFGTGIEKSLVDTLGKLDGQDTFLKSLGQGITDRFAALGNILKGSLDQGSVLQKQVDALIKSNTELTTRLQGVEQTSQGRKSVVTQAQAVERFQKSAEETGALLPNGARVQYDIRKAQDRDTLAGIMYEDAKKARENNTPDHNLEKAIGDLEISKSMNAQLLPYLRNKGIHVVG